MKIVHKSGGCNKYNLDLVDIATLDYILKIYSSSKLRYITYYKVRLEQF